MYDELIKCFSDYAKISNESFEFVIDSFPVKACENIRLPVEFKILPGAVSDVRGAKELPCNLPSGSTLFGDKAYGSYKMENKLRCTKNI